MDKLKDIFVGLLGSFTPPPPPLGLDVKKTETFYVDLLRLKITAPDWWEELKHFDGLLAHEIKHASSDGLPYTHRNALRFEAATMQMLGVDAKTARWILNVVYDAVVDLRASKEGLDMKAVCEEWLKRFPVTREAEGSNYHLLQILYKDFFKIRLKETEYERWVKQRSEYGELKQIIFELAREGESFSETRDTYKVAYACQLIYRLSKVIPPPQGEDVGFDRGDPQAQADAAEAGMEMGLLSEQLADLMGARSERELEEKLEEVAEYKARQALWRKILGFRELFRGSGFYELKEPTPRKWKPWSRKIDPVSVARNPDDPRKWLETAPQTVMTVETEGEFGGFGKAILLVDHSGSTADFYLDRPVLSWIKDTAYGLIAYAKEKELTVATIAFSTDARILAKESRNYMEHAKKIFMLRSGGNTNLYEAVDLSLKLKPEKALLAVITDGFVTPEDLKYLEEQTKANKVIVAVTNPMGKENVLKYGDKIAVYEAKPDNAGKIVVEELTKT